MKRLRLDRPLPRTAGPREYRDERQERERFSGQSILTTSPRRPRTKGASSSFPPPVQGLRRDLREHRAQKRSADDVARVVDAGMDARVRNQRREGAQRDCAHRHHLTHPCRESERCRGVSGRERRRGRHPHMTGQRDALGRTIRAPAPAERLDRKVDNSRRHADTGQPRCGCATAPPSTGEGKQRGRGDREPRVVGRSGKPAHGTVERGGGRAGDRRIERDIHALCVLQPATIRSAAHPRRIP